VRAKDSSLRSPPLAALGQVQPQVVGHAQFAEDHVLLWCVGDAQSQARMCCGACQVAPAPVHAALGQRQETGQRAQQRGLAHAVAAEHAEHAPRRHGAAHATHDEGVAIAADHLLERKSVDHLRPPA